MTITPEFFLKFIQYAVFGACVLFVCLTILGAISVWKAGKDALTPVLQLATQGDMLRMLTVVFIVSAATGLLVLDKVRGESVITVLSGIAGYVLGGYGRGKKASTET